MPPEGIRMSDHRFLAGLLAAAFLAGLATPAQAHQVSCDITYTLSSWAVFYKTARGHGTVTCSDGQSMDVLLRSEGGGFTFGKSTIDDGHGRFTGVHDISDVLGDYASGGAHAGAGQSAAASGLTKGEVSLSMTGTGRGVDLGVDFGRFTISKE
jgi:hypothetical protein